MPLLQGAHFKAQFDWCAFGGSTKRSSIIVASSPAFKRMRWTCKQQEFVHQHSGCADQSLPTALVHLFVFSCMHCVDGALGPPVFITAERLPRLFPCHVLSDVFAQSPEDHQGKFVVCRTQHECHFCSTLHRFPPRLRVFLRPHKQFLAALEEQSLPVLPHDTPHFQRFHKWVTKSRKKAIGLPLSFPISRKLVTGRWTATAGTRIFGHAVHPFLADADLPADVLNAVRFQSQSPLVVRNFQEEQHSFWLHRAEQLRAKSLSQLHAVEDPVLRAYFLRDVQDQDSLFLTLNTGERS